MERGARRRDARRLPLAHRAGPPRAARLRPAWSRRPRAFAEATARLYDLAAADRRPQRPHARRGRGTSPRARQVFTAGRLWDEGKNLAVLDAAAALLDAPCFAAGPLKGPNGAAIALAHARPLGILAPDHVGEWLARSPVFASLARYEPFGLAVLEAAQAGCALVLSDIPTFRELWDGAAVFVPANDPTAAAAALDALLAAPERTAELGAAARAASARYTVEAMAERHARPLRRAARQPARAPALGGGGVRVVYFTHSLASCWNHGNAHFLRGVLRELVAPRPRGARLRARGRLEPAEPARRPRRAGPRRLPRRLPGARLHPLRPALRTRPRPAPTPTS